MKRTLSTLIVLVLLTLGSHAADIVGELAGVWYETKSKDGTIPQAGAMHIWFYSDFTVYAEFYLDGTYAAESADSFWYVTNSGKVKFAFEDVDGWLYNGTVTGGLLKGKLFNRGGSGNIQCGDTSLAIEAALLKSATQRSLKRAP